MAQQQPDRRVQRTRNGLHQALVDLILEKRYDKITVQEIIDRADVGRSTFYSHFLDKDDLLVYGLRRFGEQFSEEVESAMAGDPADAEQERQEEHVLRSLVFFKHAYENSDLYRAMFSGGGGEFLLETGRKHITADIEQHLGARIGDGDQLTIPLPVVSRFLAGAMMSVLVWWLENDMPIPPEEVNALYQSLALPSVRAAFNGDDPDPPS